MNNKKIKWLTTILFSSLGVGLIAYSTVYYSHNPLPTYEQLKESLVTEVFNQYFNEENEVVVDKQPTNGWEVVGSESNLMKDFYSELYNSANYNFSDVKIEYNGDPILNETNVSVDFKLTINNLDSTWVYKGVINYKVA